MAAYAGHEMAAVPVQPPVIEQAQLLEERLEAACQQLDAARRLIEEWQPVRLSCEAGLAALSKAQDSSEVARF